MNRSYSFTLQIYSVVSPLTILALTFNPKLMTFHGLLIPSKNQMQKYATAQQPEMTDVQNHNTSCTSAATQLCGVTRMWGKTQQQGNSMYKL